MHLSACAPCLASIALLAGAAYASTPAPDDKQVQSIIAGTGFSGAIVLARKGEVVYARGFGEADREQSRPFTPDTASDGASIAKTFTAAATLLLVAEGRLDLDDPVVRHLSRFPYPQTRLRHLLAHTTGLPEYDTFDADLPVGQLRTAEAMLALLATKRPPLAFEPGSQFVYSSLGFDLLALVVERVAGQPYEAFVRQRLFQPLGMSSSFARPAFFADWPQPRTLGYRERDGQWVRFDVFDGEDFHGGSNWYLTAQDLSRWAAAFARSAGLPAAVQQGATQPVRLDAGQVLEFTQGSWHCDSAGVRCQFGGDLRAFQTFVHWDRSRQESAVYVANSTLPPWQRTRIARDLVAALAGAPAPPVDATPLMRVPREALASLAGSYRHATYGTIEVRVDGTNISLHAPQRPAYRVYRVTADTYYVPGLDHWLGFSGDKEPQTLHIRTLDGDEQAPRLAVARPA